jgi:hypothetical protein
VIRPGRRSLAALPTADAGAVAPAVLALAAACALLLIVPGETVVTKDVNHLFVFLDGAYRIVSSQVPNRGIHAALPFPQSVVAR